MSYEFIQSEYDFYIQEAKAIREIFKRSYGDEYSPDGVITPKSMFVKNRPRVIFLMKENRNKGSWSLVDEIENDYFIVPHKNNSSKSWAPNICRTFHYLITEEFWEKVPQKDEYKVDGLGYINVKKRDEGEKQSVDFDLDNYAKNDAENLQRQIISCKPDVVFCCQSGEQQLARLSTIMQQKFNTPVNNIPFAYEFNYQYQAQSCKAIAVKWFHPSRNKLSINEMKRRLTLLKPLIDQINLRNSG